MKTIFNLNNEEITKVEEKKKKKKEKRKEEKRNLSKKRKRHKKTQQSSTGLLYHPTVSFFSFILQWREYLHVWSEEAYTGGEACYLR